MRRRNSLVDETAENLRQLIASGKLQPGEYLPPQRELAARFGVGASTIHEAIQVLSAVGLLQAHPGKGTWVREDVQQNLITPEAVKARLGELHAPSVYEARSVIEVALTGLAAGRATPAETARIEEALVAMRANVNDVDAFVRADVDFHLAVAAAGHNDLLAQFYHLSRTLLEEVIHEMILLPKVREASIRIQADILEAIQRHDPARARRAAGRHMRYIRSLIDK